MKATIESTEEIMELNGLPVRIWKGKTEKGVECTMYIPLIQVSVDENVEEFDRDLTLKYFSK